MYSSPPAPPIPVRGCEGGAWGGSGGSGAWGPSKYLMFSEAPANESGKRLDQDRQGTRACRGAGHGRGHRVGTQAGTADKGPAAADPAVGQRPTVPTAGGGRGVGIPRPAGCLAGPTRRVTALRAAANRAATQQPLGRLARATSLGVSHCLESWEALWAWCVIAIPSSATRAGPRPSLEIVDLERRLRDRSAVLDLYPEAHASGASRPRTPTGS
jgi:hypothetical protein